MKEPCVYILASQPYGTLYIGFLSLVRFEMCDTMEQAILREKQLKRWHRQWKINLIESENPRWMDLAVGSGSPPVAPRLGHNGC
ncbi:MAG: GIY-YIG nuclease family protein [Sphingobium sp.]